MGSDSVGRPAMRSRYIEKVSWEFCWVTALWVAAMSASGTANPHAWAARGSFGQDRWSDVSSVADGNDLASGASHHAVEGTERGDEGPLRPHVGDDVRRDGEVE